MMKTTCKTSWHRSQGITLIEVLAALMLMSVILVALVTARGSLLTQHAQATAKQDAVHAAETLLAGWWASDPALALQADRGEITNHPGWVWTTSETPPPSKTLPSVRRVRLAIVDERDPQNPQTLTEVHFLVDGASLQTPPNTSGQVSITTQGHQP